MHSDISGSEWVGGDITKKDHGRDQSYAVACALTELGRTSARSFKSYILNFKIRHFNSAEHRGDPALPSINSDRNNGKAMTLGANVDDFIHHDSHRSEKITEGEM